MIDKRLMLGLICLILLAISLTIFTMLYLEGGGLQIKVLKSQVSSLNSQLMSTNNEKSVLESQILDFHSKVTALETVNAALQSQVSNLQSENAVLENEVGQNYNSGYDDGEAEGYQKGVIDGAGIGYNIRDPTYAEAVAFIASDQTDKNYWTEDYVCMNFVADFKNNAFNAGFRAGCVYIEFPNNVVHGITCFNTVDNGLIFIETQSDEIVTLTIGDVYYDRTIHDPPNFDDTIDHYVIIW